MQSNGDVIGGVSAQPIATVLIEESTPSERMLILGPS